MSEKVSCVAGARWRRQGFGTGGNEKATVERGIGFLGTRERKDWERKGERKGQEKGRLGKGSEGRKWWNVEKGGKEKGK